MFVWCSAVFADEAVSPDADDLDGQLETLSAQVLDRQIAGSVPDVFDADTVLREAASLLATKQPFAAAALLSRSVTDDANWRRLSAEALLACGLPQRAQALLDELPQDDTNQFTQRLRLDLADFYFRRGDTSEAAASLPAKAPTHGELRLRWATLAANILLAQQRPAEAAARLNEIVGRDPLELLSLDRSDDLTIHYLRYNLAVSLIRAGDAARGRSLLDRLGQLKIDTPEVRALRDRANLSLGDALLRDRQGATAREMYLRVNSGGPFASRALLGLGWASLAEQGSAQPRAEIGKTAAAYREAPDFVLRALRHQGLIECREYNRQPHAAGSLCTNDNELARSDAGSDENYRRRLALVPWKILIEQHPEDPAAQEADLAMASVLAQLGATAEAAKRYQLAADALTREQEALRATVSVLRREAPPSVADDAEKFTAQIRLEEFDAALSPYRLGELYADVEFMRAHSGVEAARDLARMTDAEELRSVLATLADRYGELASEVAIRHLEHEDGLLRQYREAALKGLLSIQDPQ